MAPSPVPRLSPRSGARFPVDCLPVRGTSIKLDLPRLQQSPGADEAKEGVDEAQVAYAEAGEG